MIIVLVGLLLCALATVGGAQQIVDSAFHARVVAPTYARGTGPLVLIDEAHNNAKTMSGQYRPLADLLLADGYRLEALERPFTRAALGRGEILVIINPLASVNVDHWILPTPSAFDSTEERTIAEWVTAGGALLLVADHMPFPGAAEALARRFGVAFTNGFAVDTLTWDPIVFRRSDGSLAEHPITDGRGAGERVDSIATFDGQGFRASDPRVRGVMTLGRGVISYYPDTAWRFPQPWVPTRPMQGWLQGAALTFGRGRVLVLGEAGMLSAQVSGPKRSPMGMNAPVARQNQQFVLNAFRWLGGLLAPSDG
jgi:hypothetical protein